MLAATCLLYGQLGNATRPALQTHPVLHLNKQGKVIRIAAVQPAAATIHLTGLGQLSLDRQQLLIASGIALAVIAGAATAIGWLIAGQVLRPLRTITAAARRISASSLHERLALHGPDDELKELADTLDSLFARLPLLLRRLVARAASRGGPGARPDLRPPARSRAVHVNCSRTSQDPSANRLRR
ncbi:MAG: HAMP domain-containing protein [Streptosporangiaceae bacterium]